MQLARVIGHATSTIKHRSMNGWRLVLAQQLGATKQPDGDVVVAVDKFGAGPGELVLLNLDGKAAREYVNDDKSPVRHFVIGVVDEN